jgi:uncharacterized protein with FMN-binding domain
MSATPWRGTLIFAGGIAAIAATAVTRFAGADVAAAAGGPVDPAAPGTTSAPGSSADGTAGAGSSSSASDGTATPGSSSSSDATSPSADPAATPSADPTQAGAVTIVGSTVQTRFGAMQVSVTFDGADVTDVQALQYPAWHRESEQINAYAVPILVREAVAADSATIDTVSGATVSSEAFRQSLQSAIDQHG